MNKIIRNKWSRWSIYVLLGILFKFILDVIYTLLFRNYELFQPFIDYFYAVVLTACTLETIYYLRYKLAARISWEDNPRRRFIYQWLFSLGTGLFFAFVIRLSEKLIFSNVYYIRVQDEMILLLLVTLGATGIVVSELGLYLLNKWRVSLAELERFKKENAEFQFESLRSQVNPHFLFNSLNTLSSLVHEDAEKAGSFIRELSDVYRYILENRGKELVTMEKELAVARSYIYLVQLRFEKNLSIDLDVPDSCRNFMIAPLTLQLLVENAVKHNVISRKKPLHIYIYVEAGRLVIRNNLQKKESREYSSQLGLKNIQSRYGFLTDQKMMIIETEKEFIVKIPLIKRK